MSTDLPPLPPELLADIAAERARVVPSELVERIAQRAAATTLAFPPNVPAVPGAGAIGSVTSAVGTKLLVTAFTAGMLLGGGVGATAVALLTRPAPVSAPTAPLPAEPAAAIVPEAAALPSPLPGDAGRPAAIPSRPPRAIAAPSAPPDAGAAGSAQDSTRIDRESPERLLLERARSANSRAMYQEALQIVDEHRRLYPASELREERDALSIAALAGAGRTAEASIAAQAFLERFPDSVFAPLVRRALRNQETIP